MTIAVAMKIIGSVDIYEEIVKLRRQGQRAAVATIVRRLGSTPRKDNAKMLIREDGSSVGSVGGGCTEAEVWRESKRVIETAQAKLMKFELTQEDAEEDGLICGGTVEVFVEPILPDPKVILMGAGHLGQSIAAAAHRVGFKVSVLDDRAAFANRERFPDADEIVAASFDTSLDRVSATDDSFILIVTRGHNHDQLALSKALATGARYVGLVGSRRKIQIIVRNLMEQGLPPQAFANLYAPIGIEIGSETPEEIAISVVAELLAIRKGVHQRSPKQLFVMKLLEEATSQQSVSS